MLEQLPRCNKVCLLGFSYKAKVNDGDETISNTTIFALMWVDSIFWLKG